MYHFIDIVRSSATYIIFKGIHVKHYFGTGLSTSEDIWISYRATFNTKMVLDQFKIKYPLPQKMIYDIWAHLLLQSLTKGLFNRTAAMGGKKERNRSWLWCTHFTVHKWSFHEDIANEERRTDKKHSWRRNGIAASPLCLVQLLRMAISWLWLLWIISLSLSSPPPPRLPTEDKMQLPGPPEISQQSATVK